MIFQMLVVALAAAAIGSLLSYIWVTQAYRRPNVLSAQTLAARVHDMRQPIQAIELYTSALERRLATDADRHLASCIHLAITELHARLADLSRDAGLSVAAERSPLPSADAPHV